MARGMPTALVALLACLVLAACGDADTGGPPAVGRYALDRMDFARKLADEHLLTKDGKARADVTPERRAEVRKNALAQARAIQLDLELRADGAFLARFTDASGEQRFGGAWSRTGDEIAFRTTSIPGGRVTTIPDVRARRTAQGLLFDGATSGFVVPHAFLLRSVD